MTPTLQQLDHAIHGLMLIADSYRRHGKKCALALVLWRLRRFKRMRWELRRQTMMSALHTVEGT
jgi:hypothetical protein